MKARKDSLINMTELLLNAIKLKIRNTRYLQEYIYMLKVNRRQKDKRQTDNSIISGRQRGRLGRGDSGFPPTTLTSVLNAYVFKNSITMDSHF